MEIGELLACVIERGASDLHLSTGLPPLLRVDGDMQALGGPALAASDVRAMVREVMGEERRRAFDGSREVDFACELPDGARFRVNAYRQHRGPAAAFRSIPAEAPGMEALDMGSVYRDIAGAPRGLVLVTGPAGSGKSTTLAAMIDFINAHRAGHILTIEDPIEFVHGNKRCLVHQREVGRDTESFDAALRAALREDPDVILVGEMRDRETIALALTARGQVHRPHRGRVPGRREGGGADGAFGVSPRGHFASPGPPDRRRSRGGPGGALGDARHPQSRAGGQGGADLLGDPDGRGGRDADPRPRVFANSWARGWWHPKRPVAETGHLVFATLHTASAAKSIDRIVDAFPAGEKVGVRTALSESLHAVISQALVPRIVGGRVAAREVLLATPAIRNLVREDKAAQIYSAIQTGAAEGMRTLDQSLRELVGAGVVAPEAARRVAKAAELFERP